MFVCAQLPDSDAITPVGTAFLIGLPGEHGAVFKYFVTAGHVVRSDPRWIRLRRQDGQPPEDKLVGEWIHHPTADLAATPCDLKTAHYIANWQDEKHFCDKWPPGFPINLGERAYFMGLLTDVDSMAKRAVPMMRAATIGAMYVENVPVKDRRPDLTVYPRMEPSAHLIDCYSRSGFSGAPVYVDHAIAKIYERPQALGRISEQVATGAIPATYRASEEVISTEVTSLPALFGVLVGHFGSPSDNAGVAIVVPIDALRELLDDKRLVEWQERKARAIDQERRQRRDEGAAVLDVVQPEPEFQCFEDLTRKLVQVPKRELDAERRDE